MVWSLAMILHIARAD